MSTETMVQEERPKQEALAEFQKFTKDVGLSAAIDFLLKLKGFILMPILTKALGTLNYGIWAEVSVTVSLLTPLVILGLDGAMMRFLAGKTDKQEIREGYYSIFAFWLFTSLLAAFLLIVGSRPLATMLFGGVENAPFVMLGGALVVIMVLRNATKIYFRTFGQIKTFQALNLVEAVLVPVLTAIAVLLGYGLMGAVIGTLLSELVIVLISLPMIVKQLGIHWPHFTELRGYLAYGIPIAPIGLLLWVVAASDRYVIGYFKGPSDVGIYSVAYSLGMLCSLYFPPMYLAFAPLSAKLWDRGQQEELRRVFKYSLKYGLLISIPAAVGMSVLARSLLQTLATPAFLGAASLIPLIAAGYVLFNVSGMAETLLGLAKKTRIVFVIYAISAVINVALNLVLVPTVGILGSALGTLMAYGFLMVSNFWLGFRVFRFELPWLTIVQSLLASALMGLVVWLWHLQGRWGLVFAVGGGTAVYFASLWVLGGIKRHEAAFLVDTLKDVLWMLKLRLTHRSSGSREYEESKAK